MNINENDGKNEVNERDLEQAAGGNAVFRTVKIRFRCPNCGNVRIFTDSIGSTKCDCGAEMKPVDSTLA